MKLDSLSPYIFARMQKYLENSDKKSLALTSKKINNFGWKETVQYDGSNYKKFILECSKHKFNITNMIIKNVQNPILWIPFWAKNMTFINCTPVIPTIKSIKNKESKIKIVEEHNGKTNSIFIDVPSLSALY